MRTIAIAFAWLFVFVFPQWGRAQTADSTGDKPDLYYFVIDRSGSIKFPNRLVGPITEYFTNQVNAIPAGSEVRLVFFNQKAGAQKVWPSITGAERASIFEYFRNGFQPEGGTRLYDTTAEALKHVLAVRENYGGVQLLVLTDGDDTDSREFKSWQQVETLAKRMTNANSDSYATVFFLGHTPGTTPTSPFKVIIDKQPAPGSIPKIVLPPRAGFTVSPTKAKPGEPVTFSIHSAAQGTEAEWDAGDGTTFSGINPPPHRYQRTGTYTVTLKVKGRGGVATSKQAGAVQIVPDVPLEARFRVIPNLARAGESVQFVNDSLGGPTSHEWSFPGDAVKLVANPTHTFSQAGTFPVRLSIKREDQTSKPFMMQITVLPPKPKPEFRIQPAGRAARFGETVTLTAAAVGDGDEHIWTIGGDETLRGREVRWVATNAGLLTIVHTVEGPGGISINENVLLVDKPEAGFTITPASRQAKLGERFELRATPVPDMEHHWVVGTNLFTGVAVVWEASQLGRIEALHKVFGPGGSNASIDALFVLPREGPNARFAVLPESKEAMLAQNFTFTASATAGLAHAWKLGGTASTETSAVLTWTASQLGRVEVEHTAFDATGTNRHTEVVLVTNLPPPDASFTVSPESRSVLVGQPFSFQSTRPVQGEQHRFVVSSGSVATPVSGGTNGTWIGTSAGLFRLTHLVIGRGGSSSNFADLLVTNKVSKVLDASFTILPTNQVVAGSVVRLKAFRTELGWTHNFNIGGKKNLPGPEVEWRADIEGAVKIIHTVTSADGAGTTSDTIVVQPDVYLQISGFPTNGVVPVKVQFKVQARGAIRTYAWDFGDGESSLDHEPIHEYKKGGSYSVRLKVVDPIGRPLEAKMELSFTNPVPWWLKLLVTLGAVALVAALIYWWFRPLDISGQMLWDYEGKEGRQNVTGTEYDLKLLEISGWKPKKEYVVRNNRGAWYQRSRNNPCLYADGHESHDLRSPRSFVLEGVTFRFHQM